MNANEAYGDQPDPATYEVADDDASSAAAADDSDPHEDSTAHPLSSVFCVVDLERRAWSRHVRRASLAAVLSYLAFLVAYTATVFFVVPFLGFRPNPATDMAFGIVVGGLVLFVGGKLFWWLPQRRARHTAFAAASEVSAEPAALTDIVRRDLSQRKWIDLRHYAGFLSNALVWEGCAGAVICFRSSRQTWTPRPVESQFEPTPLDEAEASFRELGEALDIQDGATGRPLIAGRSPLRRVIRNITLGENWFYALAVSLFLVMDIRECLEQRRITSWLGFMMFLFWYYVLRPRNTAWSRGTQWLIVPGGVLLRGKCLKVLARSQCVLVLRQKPFWTWEVIITDGDTCVGRPMMRAEAAVLLSAWLSPLRPPALDQMSDLV